MELITTTLDNKPITELKTIAQHFNKRPSDLMRTIKSLIATDVTLSSEFIETTYKDVTGRKLPTYYVTQEGFALLVMGFTGKEALAWKREFYRQFESMRTVLNERNFALVESKCEKLEKQLHLLHWDNRAKTLGEKLYTATELGKELGLSARRLNQQLERMNILQRVNGVLVIMPQLKDSGLVEVTTYEHDSGVNILTKWTENGRAFVLNLLKNA